MGLINFVLKVGILTLNLRDGYDVLNIRNLHELGKPSRQVAVTKKSQDGDQAGSSQRQYRDQPRVGTSARRSSARSALACMLVWILFLFLEPTSDRFLSWIIPFYDSCKTLLLLWMLFTRTHGAAIIFSRFIKPSVKPYESILDTVVLGSIGITQLCLDLTLTFTSRLTMQASVWFRGTWFCPKEGVQQATQSPQSNEMVKRSQRRSQGKSHDRSNASSGPPSEQNKEAMMPIGVSKSGGPSLSKGNSHGSSSSTALPRLTRVGTSTQRASEASKEAWTKTGRVGSNLSADLGKVPEPPTLLRNYAHIPSSTTTAMSSGSLLSPQPKLPGAFNFSFVAPPSGIGPSPTAPVFPSVPSHDVQETHSTVPQQPPAFSSLKQGQERSLSTTSAEVTSKSRKRDPEDDQIVAPPRKTRSTTRLKTKANKPLLRNTGSASTSVRNVPSNKASRSSELATTIASSTPRKNGAERNGTGRRKRARPADDEAESDTKQPPRSSPRKKRRAAESSLPVAKTSSVKANEPVPLRTASANAASQGRGARVNPPARNAQEKPPVGPSASSKANITTKSGASRVTRSKSRVDLSK